MQFLDGIFAIFAKISQILRENVGVKSFGK